jgi:transketolase
MARRSVATPPRAWQDDARRIASGVRRRVLEYTIQHNGGYLSQACSAAEILGTLYARVMRLGASVAPPVPPSFPGVPTGANRDTFTGAGYNGPMAPDLDRFILSPAHYALVLYATLIEAGRLAPDALGQFNRDGSTVEMIGAEHSPGMEVMTGSLGQGLSQAVGIAMARRGRGDTGRVWVFMSDGEFQEGQTWEAFAVMAHYRLDNVGVYVDVNAQQCDGLMASVLAIEPLHDRLAAFGARVHRVDGHQIDALAAPAALAPDGRPLVVLAETDPCRGIDLMRSRAPFLHYLRFKSDEERDHYRAALARLTEASG